MYLLVVCVEDGFSQIQSHILFPLADSYSFNFNVFVWMIMQSDFHKFNKEILVLLQKFEVILAYLRAVHRVVVG